jgi:hypothetical protein
MPHPQEANFKRLLEAGFAAISRVLTGRTFTEMPFPRLNPAGAETFEDSQIVFTGPEPFGAITAALNVEPAMAELADIVATDDLLRRRLGRYSSSGSAVPDDELPGIVRHHVTMLFQDYVKRGGTVEIDSERFEHFWNTIWPEITRDSSLALRKIWVVNLGVHERAYKLSPHLILRSLSARDQAPATTTSFMLPGHSILESLTTIINPKLPETRTEDEDDLDVVLAVLYKTFAKATMITAYSVGYSGGGGMSGAMPSDPGQADYLDITDERATRISEFMPLVRVARNNRVVAIAMRRLVSARRRQSTEDAFIDYWIALESLFGTAKTELTFRMSLRIAAFIESEPDSRRHRFEQPAESYDYRSRLVHGERGTPTRQMLETTEEMLRLSLYKICHSPTSYHLGTLEQDVLSGKQIAIEGLTLIPPIPIDFR